MKNFFGLLWKVLFTTIVVLAGLSNIGVYLEQGKAPPWVVEMISSYISLRFLSLLFQLLFLFAVAVSLWRVVTRVVAMEGEIEKLDKIGDLSLKEGKAIKNLHERVSKLEGGRDPYVLLQPGEILHPTPNPVLWRWDAAVGADGPFCPRHRERLFYRYQVGGDGQRDNLDERWLSGGGWLYCPNDGEEFKYVERHIKVKDLRGEAAFRLNQKK